MSSAFSRKLEILAMTLAVSTTLAFADAGTWAPDASTDPNFIAAKKAIDAKDW